ncbi:hypothetical protein ACLX1H_004431 [Fusarium chlamydosporum]
MKISTIALLLVGAVAAAPSDKPIESPAAKIVEEPVPMAVASKAACSIQCTFWYRKCYSPPWTYTCDANGRFARRKSNPYCEKNCWCKCDGKI